MDDDPLLGTIALWTVTLSRGAEKKTRNDCVKRCAIGWYCAAEVAEEITNQVPDFASRKDTDAKLPPSISKKVSRSCSNGSSGGVGGVIQPSVVDVADLMDSFELAQLSNQLQETTLSPTSKAPSKAPSKASPKTPSTTAAEDEEDSWEKLYNESGDILRPEALAEVIESF